MSFENANKQKIKILIMDIEKNDLSVTESINVMFALGFCYGNDVEIIWAVKEKMVNFLEYSDIKIVILINGGSRSGAFFRRYKKILTKFKLIVIGDFGLEKSNKSFFKEADLFLQSFRGSIPEIFQIVDKVRRS